MSGVVRASLDVALEVLADGFSCEAALAEWMLRLSDQGLRYCPLAQEQILLSCIDEDEEEPELDFPVEPTEADLEIPEEGSLIIPELEVVPQPEELALEQGKLPPPPLPVVERATVGDSDPWPWVYILWNGAVGVGAPIRRSAATYAFALNNSEAWVGADPRRSFEIRRRFVDEPFYPG